MQNHEKNDCLNLWKARIMPKMRQSTIEKIEKVATMYAEDEDMTLYELTCKVRHNPALITRHLKTDIWFQVMQDYGYDKPKETKRKLK